MVEGRGRTHGSAMVVPDFDDRDTDASRHAHQSPILQSMHADLAAAHHSQSAATGCHLFQYRHLSTLTPSCKMQIAAGFANRILFTYPCQL